MIVKMIEEMIAHKDAIDKAVKIAEAASKNSAYLKVARGSLHNLVENLERHLEANPEETPAAPVVAAPSETAAPGVATEGKTVDQAAAN